MALVAGGTMAADSFGSAGWSFDGIGITLGGGMQYMAFVGRITDLLRAKLLFFVGTLARSVAGRKIADPLGFAGKASRRWG